MQRFPGPYVPNAAFTSSKPRASLRLWAVINPTRPGPSGEEWSMGSQERWTGLKAGVVRGKQWAWDQTSDRREALEATQRPLSIGG